MGEPVAERVAVGLTWDDLLATEEEEARRRDLIDGDLIVTPAPSLRHQRAVGRIYRVLNSYAEEHGGEAIVSPMDVVLARDTVVQPDVCYLSTPPPAEQQWVFAPPQLVVEVSSPSTRRLDRVRKFDVYARFGVGEYWIVDLDRDRVEVYELAEGSWRPATVAERGETVVSARLERLAVDADELLA